MKHTIIPLDPSLLPDAHHLHHAAAHTILYSGGGPVNCLGFSGNPPPLGTILKQSTCTGGAGQLFVLRYLAGGYVSFVDAWGNCWTVNGTELAISSSSMAINGSAVINSPCLGKENQAFLLRSTGPTT